MYEIRKRAGWHGSPSDPVIETGDEITKDVINEAGEHVCIPGNGWRSPIYLVEIDDETGEDRPVDCPATIQCEECGDYVPLASRCASGYDDDVCIDAMAPHTIEWVCENCWIASIKTK